MTDKMQEKDNCIAYRETAANHTPGKKSGHNDQPDDEQW